MPLPYAVMPSPVQGADYQQSLSDLLAGYQRRGGTTGGMWKGAGKGALAGGQASLYTGGVGAIPLIAGGAIYGGIKGAIQKKAKSAPTDFALTDAQDALQRGYQQHLGRAASQDEINSQLSGQGWQHGDRYVGEKGLTSVLNSLRDSQEAKARLAQPSAAPQQQTPGRLPANTSLSELLRLLQGR